jgi:hypothetical protein
VWLGGGGIDEVGEVVERDLVRVRGGCEGERLVDDGDSRRERRKRCGGERERGRDWRRVCVR